MTPIVLDIATAPMAGVEQYITPNDPPANYKKPEAIEKWQAEDVAEQIEKAALDLDLCVITGVGMHGGPTGGTPVIRTLNDTDEAGLLNCVMAIMGSPIRPLISFNGLRFDWLVLMRRALYLDVPFPKINVDKYRTPHYDLFNILGHNGTVKAKSLCFYVNRFGWLDLEKPLSGAEEAKVLQTGDWDGLRKSIAHDVEATRRLAQKMGVL